MQALLDENNTEGVKVTQLLKENFPKIPDDTDMKLREYHISQVIWQLYEFFSENEPGLYVMDDEEYRSSVLLDHIGVYKDFGIFSSADHEISVEPRNVLVPIHETTFFSSGELESTITYYQQKYPNSILRLLLLLPEYVYDQFSQHRMTNCNITETNKILTVLNTQQILNGFRKARVTQTTVEELAGYKLVDLSDYLDTPEFKRAVSCGGQIFIEQINKLLVDIDERYMAELRQLRNSGSDDKLALTFDKLYSVSSSMGDKARIISAYLSLYKHYTVCDRYNGSNYWTSCNMVSGKVWDVHCQDYLYFLQNIPDLFFRNTRSSSISIALFAMDYETLARGNHGLRVNAWAMPLNKVLQNNVGLSDVITICDPINQVELVRFGDRELGQLNDIKSTDRVKGFAAEKIFRKISDCMFNLAHMDNENVLAHECAEHNPDFTNVFFFKRNGVVMVGFLCEISGKLPFLCKVLDGNFAAIHTELDANSIYNIHNIDIAADFEKHPAVVQLCRVTHANKRIYYKDPNARLVIHKQLPSTCIGVLYTLAGQFLDSVQNIPFDVLAIYNTKKGGFRGNQANVLTKYGVSLAELRKNYLSFFGEPILYADKPLKLSEKYWG